MTCFRTIDNALAPRDVSHLQNSSETVALRLQPELRLIRHSIGVAVAGDGGIVHDTHNWARASVMDGQEIRNSM